MKIFSKVKLHESLRGHPQEDFLFLSKKYPIFVVADGVTLNIKEGEEYPRKSGAFKAAKIFCETVITEAEKRYENFKKSDLPEIFEAGNRAVRDYNISCDRSENTINYYDIDLFSATASFVLIKDSKVFWFSLCDSYMAVYGKSGKQKFVSPDGWLYFPKNWEEGANTKEKIVIRHRDYRNAIDRGGRPSGYGVVSGQERARNYLNRGALDVGEGDLVFLYTDGFENYFETKEFIELFRAWPENLGKKIDEIISKKSKEDLKKFGAEKTLIAIAI